MNFKRNCLAIITLVGSVFAVAGCKDANLFSEYQNISEVVDNHEDFVSDDGSYKKYGDYLDYKAVVNSAVEIEPE